MKKIILSIAFCSLLLPFKSNAQALSATEIKDQMVKDWERAKEYTIEYLNTMPADKYSFRAVDSIRSFAQHMLHLSVVNVLFLSVAADQQPLPWAQLDLEKSTTAQNKDSVQYYVTNSYNYCINAIKKSDPSKWGEKKKVQAYEETRYAYMNKAFEHQGHHRGQTTVYIRLQGIKPPQEKLFTGNVAMTRPD